MKGRSPRARRGHRGAPRWLGLEGLVLLGATLLATGETWRIVQHYGWPAWLFWLLIVAMLSAAILNTAVLMISDARTRHADGTEPAPERIQPAD